MSPYQQVDDNAKTTPVILRYFPDPSGTPEDDLRKIYSLAQNTFLLMKLGELRDAFSYCRLSGKRSVTISNNLALNDILTFPSRLGSQQNELVVLYRKGAARPAESPAFAALEPANPPMQSITPRTRTEKKSLSTEIDKTDSSAVCDEEAHTAQRAQSTFIEVNHKLIESQSEAPDKDKSESLFAKIFGGLRLAILVFLFILLSSFQFQAIASDRTVTQSHCQSRASQTSFEFSNITCTFTMNSTKQPSLARNRRAPSLNNSLSKRAAQLRAILRAPKSQHSRS